MYTSTLEQIIHHTKASMRLYAA